MSEPRRGRTPPPAKPARVPLLLAALALAGCATAQLPHTSLHSDEIGRLEVVEVISTAPAPAVRRLAAGGGAPEEVVPRSAVDASAGELLDAVVAAGACATRRPFARSEGKPPTRPAGAVLSAGLKSINLASGAGPDPITALWLELETQLELPADPSVPESTRHGLVPRRHLVADPRPRPLSGWTADDGAPVRQAVAALAAVLAPRVVDDLALGLPPADRDRLLPPRVRQRATDQPPPVTVPTRDGGGGGEVAAAAEPVSTDVSSLPARERRRAQLRAGAAGAMTGAAYGATDGLAKCLGAGHPVVLLVCAVVVLPVFMIVGGAESVERANQEARRDSTRLAFELANAVTLPRLAEDVARANAALRLATPTGQSASVLGVSLVRLIEEPGRPRAHEPRTSGPYEPFGAPPGVEERAEEAPPRLAGLELELTLRPADGQPGGERRRCVGGPGSVPEELWFDDDAALLYGAIEAQLARAVAWGVSGLAPQVGDGPCAAPVPPPPPEPPRPPDPEPVPGSVYFGS